MTGVKISDELPSEHRRVESSKERRDGGELTQLNQWMDELITV